VPGRVRDQKHFLSHLLGGQGDKKYAKKEGAKGTKHREDSQTLLFSTVLVVNTESLNKKKQGTKVYFGEVHVFPKRILCDFCTLMVFVFICYAHKPTLVTEYCTIDF
jgi:hypothetical protein